MTFEWESGRSSCFDEFSMRNRESYTERFGRLALSLSKGQAADEPGAPR